MAIVTVQQALGVFSFLKNGVVLPVRRWGLFLRVFAVNVVLSAALLLFGVLVVRPLDAAVNPEDYRVSQGGDGFSDSAAEAEFSMYRACLLLGAGTAYLVLYKAAWLAKKVTAASAAVAACSGERHTFGSILGRVRGNLLGCSATIVLGLVIRAACAATVGAAMLAMPLILYMSHSPRLFQLDALFSVLAFQFYFYLDAVCTMAVVVAADAEPGRRRRGAPGAVACAWRLMRGTGNRALLYVAATSAMEMAAGSLSAVSVRRLPHGTDRVVALLVGASLKYVMDFVVDVISMASIAAFYFECRKRNEEKAGHID